MPLDLTRHGEDEGSASGPAAASLLLTGAAGWAGSSSDFTGVPLATGGGGAACGWSAPPSAGLADADGDEGSSGGGVPSVLLEADSGLNPGPLAPPPLVAQSASPWPASAPSEPHFF